MTHTLRIALAAVCALCLAACQTGPAESPAAKDAAGAPASSTTPASGDDARADRFTPPPDGRLTTEHVRGYLAVRRRALALATEREDGSLLQLLLRLPAAEARAAAELGRDLQEYRWAQSHVAEVAGPGGPAEAGDLLHAINVAVVKSGALIEDLARGRGQRATRVESLDSTIAHNRAVVEPFVEELLMLEQQYLRLN